LYNTYQAAREAGVRRIVFASTCQTMLAYPRDATVDVDDPPRPSSMYGATKVFGETLGRCYHDEHGMEFVGVRIGWFQAYDSEHLRKNGPGSLWLSPRDCVSLLRAAIETPDVGYALVNGTSRTDREFLSLRSARERLGWEPRDDRTAIPGLAAASGGGTT
jgi:nucleoside-diphosphate-sugar epimerase